MSKAKAPPARRNRLTMVFFKDGTGTISGNLIAFGQQCPVRMIEEWFASEGEELELTLRGKNGAAKTALLRKEAR